MAEDKGIPPARRYSDPFAALRAEMDQLFDHFSVGRFPSLPRLMEPAGAGGTMVPSIDVHESDKKIVVEAELPGIDEKDVSVTLHDSVLTVKGEKKFEEKKEEQNYHTMERRYGSFTRAVRLPNTADEDNVSADFKKGILTVTVAKKPGSEPKERQIEIKSN
ncbi:MAG: Hsp20/alpha crystallin family protein [Hyphomicrobiaceae bacterium]|nr:Hsp20/alpha crystallin family protein [Hyphomicrobiaceae bacterium]